MTFAEFRDQLLRCQTPQVGAGLVRANFDDISLLFYDAARADMIRVVSEQKHLFDAFMAGPIVREIQRNPNACEPPLIGLLILFGSFFERNGMYAELLDAYQVMPNCAARKHLSAIFLYRRVSDAATGYTQQFERILDLLSEAAVENATARACSEAILAEYVTRAVLTITSAVTTVSAERFLAKLSSADTVRAFPILSSPDFRRLLLLDVPMLAARCGRVNINAVESLYDTACFYVSPPVPPDPTADETPVDPEAIRVQLPRYLDQLIFGPGGLGGIYEQDPEAVRDGLAANDHRQKSYLGTYFPRSFAESFSIFRPLLAQAAIRDALLPKQVLNVLDVGTGTGGDLVGLLHAIASSNLTPARVDIVSLEGNSTAIAYQKRIVRECATATGLNVSLSVHEMELPSTSSGFASQLDAFLGATIASFDIVMTWKVLNEFYHRNYASAQGVYRAFLQSVEPYVAQRGICILLDTTNKVKDRNVFLPIIMNREVRAYVQNEGSRLFHVIPRSCAYWGHACRTDNCYTQRVFYVSHSARTEVESKVAYKAFAPDAFAQHLNSGAPAAMYSCNTAKPTSVCRISEIVNLPRGTTALNGFVLN